jgi:hypothetical protein
MHAEMAPMTSRFRDWPPSDDDIVGAGQPELAGSTPSEPIPDRGHDVDAGRAARGADQLDICMGTTDENVPKDGISGDYD